MLKAYYHNRHNKRVGKGTRKAEQGIMSDCFAYLGKFLFRLFGYTYFRIKENMQRAIMVIKNVITQRDGGTECWPCCPHVWRMAFPPRL